MSTNTLDDLLTAKAPKNPFGKDENDQPAPIGTTVTGTVVEVDILHVTDPASGEKQYWPDNNPKQQARIIIQTALREHAEDDGLRSIYIKLWALQKQALIAASKEAGGSPAPGDTLTATFTGVGKKTNPAFSAPKIFEYKIVKGNPLDAVIPKAEPAQPAAPSSQGGLDDAKKGQVAQLVNVGLADDAIATALTISAAEVAAYRAQIAADTSAGF